MNSRTTTSDDEAPTLEESVGYLTGLRYLDEKSKDSILDATLPQYKRLKSKVQIAYNVIWSLRHPIIAAWIQMNRHRVEDLLALMCSVVGDNNLDRARIWIWDELLSRDAMDEYLQSSADKHSIIKFLMKSTLSEIEALLKLKENLPNALQ